VLLYHGSHLQPTYIARFALHIACSLETTSLQAYAVCVATTVIRTSTVAEKQLYKFAALVALALICSTSCTSQESAFQAVMKAPVNAPVLEIDGGL